MDNTVLDPDVYADVEGLFDDKPRSGGTYLSVFHHQISQRGNKFDTEEEARANLAALQSQDEGWTGPHKTQHPKTKAEKYSNSKPYDRLIGRVVDIVKHKKEFDASKGGGKITNWDVIFLSGGKHLTLQLTWIDPVLKRFLKVAPNIDFTRPLFISAFGANRNGETKQAVSFKQYRGDLSDIAAFKNVDTWEKVPEYWLGQTDAQGKRLDGSVSTGADGSILPQPVQDEETDVWDYSAQNKFLAVYFRDKILPNVKAIAEQHGLNNPDTDSKTEAEMTHTGPPVNDGPVTVKPDNPVASNIGDLVSANHAVRIKELCAALNMTPDAATQKILSCGFDELSDEAGRYVIYVLETRAKKVGATVVPIAPPPPAPKPQPPAPVEDDDLWDTDALEAQPDPVPAQRQVVANDNGDIDDWT